NNFDQRQWDSTKTYEKYNVHESYRDKSTPQKKRKNQALNEKNEDSSSFSTSTLTMVPTAQEQDNFIEWENKKLELQQKSLEVLREEILLCEKLNSLKEL
ncbi:2339_t:CDS:2, partial [Dentiscutata erythropus]